CTPGGGGALGAGAFGSFAGCFVIHIAAERILFFFGKGDGIHGAVVVAKRCGAGLSVAGEEDDFLAVGGPARRRGAEERVVAQPMFFAALHGGDVDVFAEVVVGLAVGEPFAVGRWFGALDIAGVIGGDLPRSAACGFDDVKAVIRRREEDRPGVGQPADANLFVIGVSQFFCVRAIG